jgi:tryptophan synthase alpha subunit
MYKKIDERLELLKQQGRTGLMTHVVVGYPTLAATADLVRTMVAAGVDFVELQIPFSDPLADGSTIQRACEVALERGTRVKDAFELARNLSGQVEIPLLFMSYFNTVFQYGVERFCREAAVAGIAGLIVPDVPLEAAVHEGYFESCRQAGVYPIGTVSPLSTDERLAKNGAVAQGFVYCMARQGITGAGQGLDPGVQQYLERVRKHFKVPLAVGFGVSGRERFEQLAPHCEMVVVGSAILDIVNGSEPGMAQGNVTKFIKKLRGEAGQ